jgi:hypothetical protein
VLPSLLVAIPWPHPAFAISTLPGEAGWLGPVGPVPEIIPSHIGVSRMKIPKPIFLVCRLGKLLNFGFY